MSETFDLVTMGRIGVDIYPLQTGVGLAEVETFGKFLGGSPTNVAVAAARLGRTAAVISRTGQDPFGDYCRQALKDFGVDARWVTPVAEYPTPVTFCEIFPPDDFPLYFYRRPKAPDLVIRPGELDLDAIRAARVFWATGTGLCDEPSRTATLAALAARAAAREEPVAVATVFDLDWRPMFWGAGPGGPAGGGRSLGEGGTADAERSADSAQTAPSEQAAYSETSAQSKEAAREVYRKALAHATVAVGNVEECGVATGERDARGCAEALLAAGVELAVVKQGPAGVLAVHRDGTRAEVPPHPVEVVNGLGAGDAFGGSLCHGLLAGWDLERTVRRANAAGALVASRLACSSAMPTESELDDLLGS